MGWLLAALLPAAAFCQHVSSVAQARSLFIENLSGGADAALLRARVIHKLEENHHFRITASSADANAILSGTGAIWVRGYVSTNTRTPASNRQAVYSGYLSVQLTGKDGQPLWSWLATPSKLVGALAVGVCGSGCCGAVMSGSCAFAMRTHDKRTKLAITP